MTRTKIAEFFKGNDNFVIVTHRRPDGDTLGSSAALCRGLRKMGKTAFVLENKEITQKHRHLHQDLTKSCVDRGDVLVCVDVASKNMLPEDFLPLAEQITLRIDHHKSAESFTPLEWVDPAAAACGLEQLTMPPRA